MDDVLILNEQAVECMLQGNDQEAYIKLIEALHKLQKTILLANETNNHDLLAVRPEHPQQQQQQQQQQDEEEEEEPPDDPALQPPQKIGNCDDHHNPSEVDPAESDKESPDYDTDSEKEKDRAEDDKDEDEDDDETTGSNIDEDEYEEESLINPDDEIDIENDHERFLYYQSRNTRSKRRHDNHSRRRRRRQRSINRRRTRRRLSHDEEEEQNYNDSDISNNNNNIDDNNINNVQANDNNNLEQEEEEQPKEYIHYSVQVCDETECNHNNNEMCTIINDSEICIRPFHMRARITYIQNNIIIDTLEMGGIILYNLGCIYYKFGLLQNDSNMLFKAKYLYNQSYQHMQVTAAAFPSSIMSFDFIILMSSISYNQCQLQYECFLDMNQFNMHCQMLHSSVDTLELLRYYHEQQDDIDLLIQHTQTVLFFKTRLLFIKLRNLHYAPVA